MILGIGIDLTEIKEIEEGIQSENLVQRVFTSAEVGAVERYRNKAEHLAGKFSVKEAFMKAIGAGIRQEVWFTQIEVLNDESGKPQVQVTGEAGKRLEAIVAQQVHVSISHSGGMAVAVVILES
jgi:holo-[acyl-carrier protein] synthase